MVLYISSMHHRQSDYPSLLLLFLQRITHRFARPRKNAHSIIQECHLQNLFSPALSRRQQLQFYRLSQISIQNKLRHLARKLLFISKNSFNPLHPIYRCPSLYKIFLPKQRHFRSLPLRFTQSHLLLSFFTTRPNIFLLRLSLSLLRYFQIKLS